MIHSDFSSSTYRPKFLVYILRTSKIKHTKKHPSKGVPKIKIWNDTQKCLLLFKIAQAMDEVDIFSQFQNSWVLSLSGMSKNVKKCQHHCTLMPIDRWWWCYSCYKYMMLKNISKCQNAGMLAKSLSVTGISTSSQLPQSGIGIPASRSVWYYWSRISPALSS